MPFKSQKQRAYFHSQLPELAEEWEKHTPKGKKLPKYAPKKKKKSFLMDFKRVIAEDVAVPTPAQPGQTPQGVATPAAPVKQFDVNTLTGMIPQIMGQLDSSDISQTRNYLIQQMNVDPSVAQQATINYAMKIYKEEKAKRQNQLIQDVAKKMGLNPDVVQNWDKSSALPPLPGMKASLRRERIHKLISADLKKTFNKYAELDSAIDRVNNMTATDKIKNLYNFFKGFDSISEGVVALMAFVDEIANQLGGGPPTAGGLAYAKLSSKVGVVASLLWVVSLIMILGAAGTSDFNAKYWYLHPDKAAEAKAIVMALSSVGVAGLTTALGKFLKGKEDVKSQQEAEAKKKTRMYQGPQLDKQ